MEEELNEKHRIAIIIILVLMILLLIGVGVFFMMFGKGKTSNPEPQPTEEIQMIGDTEQPIQYAKDLGIDLRAEAEALNLSYENCIGWLRIPGTNIDTSIFQSGDNSKYLRNDRDGVYTKWGETFLDYRSDINKVQGMKNFIIYGHNTETDDHFTELMNYKSADFYSTHKEIEFSTLNDNYIWQIYAVYITDTDDFYIDTIFENEAEFNSYIASHKAKNLYNIDVNVTPDDTILTLSTCEYSRVNGRFVVQAKLVK